MDKYDVLYIFITLCVGAIFSFLLTYPTMMLWNYLMPMIFGLPKLTFWQTFGLEILVSCFVPRYSTGGKK